MAEAATEHHNPGSLAGRTVLQLLPMLSDERTGREALDVAVGLLRRGARALVASGGGPLVGELQALGGEWLEFQFVDAGFWRRRGNYRALHGLVRNERLDLLHAYGADAARAAYSVSGSTLPLVVSYEGRPPLPAWGRRADPQTGGHLLLARSQFAAGLIAERHGIAPERLRIVPSSVDIDVFDPDAVTPQRAAALRAAWHVPPGDCLLLTPGRLAESRGQLALVDAARILLNGGMQKAVFVIAANRASDAQFAGELDAHIEAQGVQRLFRRIGHCADMPAAYAASDFVVLPVQQEPLFSMLAAEAHAMGRPVVASDIGAVSEHVVAAGADARLHCTGWLTPPDDPVALARTLADALATGVHERHEIGLRARRFAENRFAREDVADATLDVYAELL